MNRLLRRAIATDTKHASILPQASSIRPYKYEPALTLVNSLCVFQMCAIPLLVNNVPNFIKIAKSTGTSPILNSIVKHTFFKHFCGNLTINLGGENLEEVVLTMSKLAKSNVGSILDLAIEADLDAADLTGTDAQRQTIQMVKLLKDCIDIASHQPESSIAVKITSLTPPALLLSWSTTLEVLHESFYKVADLEGNVDLKAFETLSATFPGLKNIKMAQIFKANDLNASGKLSYSDVTSIFSLFNIDNCRALVTESIPKSITNSSLDTAALVLKEIRILCEYAEEKKVKLMMDAEQNYFQPAIDDIAIGLCRTYNSRLDSTGGMRSPLIYNTYQMYLSSSLGRLKADVNRAAQKGYSFGLKLVRGAYMVQERELALQQNRPSPINPSIEATHKAYNDAVTFLIEQQALMPRVKDAIVGLSFVVASHNHDSINMTCNLMERHGVPRAGGWVNFGQLLGMQDGMTHTLATGGYRALKYVPYGPIEVAIAYLHRRAQENMTMVKAMGKDKDAIKSELRKRVFG